MTAWVRVADSPEFRTWFARFADHAIAELRVDAERRLRAEGLSEVDVLAGLVRLEDAVRTFYADQLEQVLLTQTTPAIVH